MIVAGVMSGTSADGIDVAIARIFGRDLSLRFDLLHHFHLPYSAPGAKFCTFADECVPHQRGRSVATEFPLGRALRGRRSQSAKRIRHTNPRSGRLPRPDDLPPGHTAAIPWQGISCTWQTGEGAVLAARLGIPVVSDFVLRIWRLAEKALRCSLFRFCLASAIAPAAASHKTSVAIANSRRSRASKTRAGDCIRYRPRQYGDRRPRLKNYSEPRLRQNGSIARRGVPGGTAAVRASPGVIDSSPRSHRKPPGVSNSDVNSQNPSCAGAEDASPRRRDRHCHGAITARSIGDALRRFVIKKNARYRDYVVSGGGVNNVTLMKMLAEQVIPLGLRLQRMEEYGVESEAKEALAFAVLAYQTWRKRPSNLPCRDRCKKIRDSRKNIAFINKKADRSPPLCTQSQSLRIDQNYLLGVSDDVELLRLQCRGVRVINLQLAANDHVDHAASADGLHSSDIASYSGDHRRVSSVKNAETWLICSPRGARRNSQRACPRTDEHFSTLYGHGVVSAWRQRRRGDRRKRGRIQLGNLTSVHQALSHGSSYIKISVVQRSDGSGYSRTRRRSQRSRTGCIQHLHSRSSAATFRTAVHYERIHIV